MNKSTPLARSLSISGSQSLDNITIKGVSKNFKKKSAQAAKGKMVCWGLPFNINKVHVLHDNEVKFKIKKTITKWLCFRHIADGFSADIGPQGVDDHVTQYPHRLHGRGKLAQRAACYYIQYADGSEVPYEILYRHQINTA
ncbi:MAG: hypothetical protein HRU15_09825, partial [Planctomycetes bacterium]|nr:hypothetical protein [Planctomycetota bacterium]